MAVRIQQWLAAQGFSSNPFEFWEADREATLSAYFVRAEWFDALRGDTRRPRSAVLFAPRGNGKSSHRLEIARLCGDAPSDPALVVQLTEYDWVLADGLDGVTSQRYVQYFARRTVEALWEALQRSPQRHAAFAAAPQRLLQLHGLLHWSGARSALLLPPLSLEPEALQSLAHAYGVSPDHPSPTAALLGAVATYYSRAQQTEIMGDLVQLARAAGYASIYVLVDRVDEDALTEHNTDATLRLIHPLLSNLHLIEYPGVAFKFFLPDHIREPMLLRRISRIEERVPAYNLTWADDDLLELLSRRLRHYSRTGTVGDTSAVYTFQDLCEQGCNADEMLVAAASQSPRRLIMLAGKIVETHCQAARQLDSKIGADTLRIRLQSSVPLLYLDPTGYIWLDRKKQPIRLTSLPRRLLELLWANRARYVTKDEVDRALYAHGERTPDALYKVVKRLREQIEPQHVNSKNYVDFVEGHGYRLHNYEEEFI